MNEVTNEKTMTLREISQALKIDYSHVYRNAKKIYPEKFINGKATMLNENQVNVLSTCLKTTVKNKPLQNAKQIEKPLTKEDLKEFTRDIVKECLSETLKQIIPLLQNQNNQKQIEIKQDYFSVLGYMKYRGIDEARFSEMICFGKEASKLSREAGKEIRKIPDERFGLVNSYHISELEKSFEI